MIAEHLIEFGNGTLNLRREHLAMLENLLIPAKTLHAANLRSLTDSEAREFLGLHRAGDYSGLYFPYYCPLTGKRVGGRIRLNDVKGDGKYISEPGCRYLYFPPILQDYLTDPSVPVVMVEAEKSALAISALASRAGSKLLPVATGGCWGWRRTIDKRSKPNGGLEDLKGPSLSLDLIVWKDRDTIICFDSNSATNPNVRRARRVLAEELTDRGASVRIAETPMLAAVNGPDDLIATSGDEAALALLRVARPFAECAQIDAEAAIAALAADKKADPLPAIESVGAVDDPMRRALLIGCLTELRIPGLTKRLIQQQIETHRAKSQQARRHSAEVARQGQSLRMELQPAELFANLIDFFSQRACLPPHASVVMGLFTMLTYCLEHFNTAPYLCFESAIPGCGKSTCLDLLSAVVARPLLSAGFSRAVLVRLMDEQQSTLLVDESEWLNGKNEASLAIKGILHGGYRRGSFYHCCEGDNHELRAFKIFGPKVFAAIRGLTGPLLDRCIVLHMERAPAESTLLSSAAEDIEPFAALLKQRLEAFSLQAAPRLQGLRKNRPAGGYWPEFRNREAELWHPLLSIARTYGPKAEESALLAAHVLNQSKQVIQAGEHRTAQAWELIEVLEALATQRFRPIDLLERLAESEAWGEALAEKKNEKAKAAAIGRFLGGFRLPSYTRSRAGSTYDRAEAIRVIGGHIPRTMSQVSSTPATSATNPVELLASSVADRLPVPPPDPTTENLCEPIWEGRLARPRSSVIDLEQRSDNAGSQPRELSDRCKGGGNVADIAVDHRYADGSSIAAASFECPDDEMVEGEI